MFYVYLMYIKDNHIQSEETIDKLSNKDVRIFIYSSELNGKNGLPLYWMNLLFETGCSKSECIYQRFCKSEGIEDELHSIAVWVQNFFFSVLIVIKNENIDVVASNVICILSCWWDFVHFGGNWLKCWIINVTRMGEHFL